MADKSTFFVRIDDPNEFRKELLYSVRDVLQCLQKFERLKDLRIQKAEKTAELRRITKDLQTYVSTLRDKLPDVEFTSKQAQKIASPKNGKKNRKTSPRAELPHREVSDELAELEGQLKNIEEKIKVIS